MDTAINPRFIQNIQGGIIGKVTPEVRSEQGVGGMMIFEYASNEALVRKKQEELDSLEHECRTMKAAVKAHWFSREE